MVKYWLLIFFIAFDFIYPQQISVQASTDSSYYLVGDYIHYKITLRYNKGIKIDFPQVKDSIKSLEFISELGVKKSETDSRVLEVHEFIFSKYDSSEVTIPPITIGYYNPNNKKRLIIKTNPVRLIIQTIQVDTNGKIQDVKAPLKISFNWINLILIILIVLLILSLVIYFLKKRKKSGEGKKVIKKIIIPPHKKALAKLYELKEKKLWQQGKIKEYHSEVTQIIRDYFEERFNILALEMTSSEIIDALLNKKDAQGVIDLVRVFFENADLVKFAKFKPLPKVNEEMMQQAIQIVKNTEPPEVEIKISEGEKNA